MIEKKIVDLSFDGENFNGGVATSLKNLDKLEKSLQLKDANKGFENITTAINGVPLDRISQGVELLASRFSVLGIVAMTVVSNITNSIINLGKRMADAVIFKPMRSGFAEYETQMNAIQTTLANTASKGTTLRDVNEALAELNDYADLTIYNFTEMTKNIGTFTAAGIDLKTSTAAIKGIANLAAISGSNAQQASTAMYQLSQALASGTVKLMDWNSVVNAGMGGQVFQDALKETARVHGIKIDDMIKKEGSFRETLQKGWLTASILTETLQKFTGDLSEEQLKSIGYTDDQIQAIMKLGKTANDAATKVKTFTQLKDTLAEALGSGWTRTWQLLLGDFEEAKKFFTYLSDTFGTIIAESSDARNHLLQDWSDAGGRTFLIEGLQTLIESLLKLKGFIGAGIGEIFKPLKYIKLLEFSLQVRKLANELEKGIIKNGPAIQRFFRGLASAVNIVTMFISSLIDFLGKMWKKLDIPKDNKILEFLARIGDFLFNLRNSIKDVDLFNVAFEKLENILGKIAEVISNLLAPALSKLSPMIEKIKEFFSSLFNGTIKIDPILSNLKDVFSNVFGSLEGIVGGLSEKLSKRFGIIGTIFETVTSLAKPAADAIGKVIKKLIDFQKSSLEKSFSSDKITSWFSSFFQGLIDWTKNTDFNKIFDAINGVLISGLLISIRKFVDSGKSQIDKVGDIGGSFKEILGSIKGVFEEATNSLKAMQESIKSDILLKIAIAVGILAVSLIALSLIDSDRLLTSIGAMTALFASLMGSVAIMEKLSTTGMAKISIGLIGLSVALLLISSAVSILAKNDPEKLKSGVIAIGALLAELSSFLALNKLLGGEGIKNAASLILLAVSLTILSKAVGKFGEMDRGVIEQGLVVVGAILAAIAAFSNLQGNNKNMVKSAIAIELIAASLIIFSYAIEKISGFSVEDLAKGLITFAATLAIVSLAINSMPSDSLKTSLSFVVMAASLSLIAIAIEKLSNMSWEGIGIGLTALAGSMIILSGALYLMKNSMSGAVVMLVAAAALSVLVPALLVLSTLSLSGLAIALGALAGTFIVFGVAGLVLGPLVPVLLGLSGAILLLGLSIAAIGLGVSLFATAMSVLAISGLAGASVLSLIVEQFANAIINFAKIIGEGAPIIAGAMVAVLTALIMAVLNKIPEMANAFMQMILIILNTINDNLPEILQKGFEIVLNLLEGIRDNLPQVVTTAIEIVVAFIDAVASKLPDIIDSGFNLIVSFIDGLADAIEENTPKIVDSMKRLGNAMIDGLGGAIADGADSIKTKIVNIAKDALEDVKRFLGIRSPSKEFYKVGQNIISGWSNALSKYGPNIPKSLEKIAEASLSTIESMSSKLSNGVNDALDIDPVIRPILDLDQLSEDSEKINTLLSKKSLALGVSGNLASKINKDFEKSVEDPSSETTGNSGDSVSFVQNNYSPKALSRLEIYRQTRNLLKPRKVV